MRGREPASRKNVSRRSLITEAREAREGGARGAREEREARGARGFGMGRPTDIYIYIYIHNI